MATDRFEWSSLPGMKTSVLAISALALLTVGGCGTVESSPSADEDMREIIETAEEFSASAEATVALAAMKLGCTEIPLATNAWIDSSLPPDFEAMEPRFLALNEAIDYHEGAVADYDPATAKLAGDDLREEPLLDSYRAALGRFAFAVDTAQDSAVTFAVSEGFNYSANFLEESALINFQVMCDEVADADY